MSSITALSSGFKAFEYAQQNKFSPGSIRGDNDLQRYSNYDMEMAQRLGLGRDSGSGHMTDEPKLPWHPSFSNESMYYRPGMQAIRWGNDGNRATLLSSKR